jgi:hypothetical protein
MDIDRNECLKMLNSDNNKDVVNVLLNQIKNLQNQVNKLSVNQGNENRNVVGDHNKVDQSVHIHISVNSYEKTDYTVLKDKIHTCIKNGKVDESKLIKLLHFNKEHPENHNIRVANKRENRIQVFNGDKFEESNYKGKNGIWKLGQENKISDEYHFEFDESIIDDDIILDEKRERTQQLETTVHNGNETSVKKKELIL